MENEVKYLYLDDIIPNRFQPREKFDEQALKELAVSISEHGVIQPIVVRQIGEKYEIIAGERRYKAATMAGLTQIPALVRNLDDKESSKVALIENLQRRDLNPIEEARTYKKILELDSLTQEELARTMGKVQSSVSNKLRLLTLTDEAQEALMEEKISERHARALLNVTDPQKQVEMVNRIIEKRITVKELEEEIKKMNESTSNEENGSSVPPQMSLENTTNNNLVEPTVDAPTTDVNTQNINVSTPEIMPTNVTPEPVPNAAGVNSVSSNMEGTPINTVETNNTPNVPETEENETVNTDPEQAVDNDKPAFDSNNLFSNLNNPPEMPTPSTNPEVDVIGGSGMIAGMKPNETVMTPENNQNVTDTHNLFGNMNIDSISGTEAVETPVDPTIGNITEVPKVETPAGANDIPSIVAEVNNLVNNVKSSGKRVEMEEFDFDDFYQLVIRIDK